MASWLSLLGFCQFLFVSAVFPQAKGWNELTLRTLCRAIVTGGGPAEKNRLLRTILSQFVSLQLEKWWMPEAKWHITLFHLRTSFCSDKYSGRVIYPLLFPPKRVILISAKRKCVIRGPNFQTMSLALWMFGLSPKNGNLNRLLLQQNCIWNCCLSEVMIGPTGWLRLIQTWFIPNWVLPVVFFKMTSLCPVSFSACL